MWQRDKTMKRPSLAETMQKVARPEVPRPAPAPEQPASQLPANDRERPHGFYAATRAGKKKLTAAVNPDVHRSFRQLGLEVGKGNESLLIEAINDLFIKYGKPPIA
jgi:antitoxin-like ribbon-helix-helix protein